MSTASESNDEGEPTPWQQRLLDRIWLLAGAALVFFTVSYVGWAIYDLMVVAG